MGSQQQALSWRPGLGAQPQMMKNAPFSQLSQPLPVPHPQVTGEQGFPTSLFTENTTP